MEYSTNYDTKVQIIVPDKDLDNILQEVMMVCEGETGGL